MLIHQANELRVYAPQKDQVTFAISPEYFLDRIFIFTGLGFQETSKWKLVWRKKNDKVKRVRGKGMEAEEEEEDTKDEGGAGERKDEKNSNS